MRFLPHSALKGAVLLVGLGMVACGGAGTQPAVDAPAMALSPAGDEPSEQEPTLAETAAAQAAARDAAAQDTEGTDDAAPDEGSQVPATAHAGAKVPVFEDDPKWGAPLAPVTIVIYSDFQCPYCNRVGPTVDELKATYGPDKLRVVWKHYPLPFHKEAYPAHVAAQTVYALGGDEAFWKFHDLAFDNQKDLAEGRFAGWAEASGVDPAQFRAAYGAKTYAKQVDASKEAAAPVGVRGTPSIYVNGVKPERRDPASMKALIDAQLERAGELLRAGVPPGLIYVKLAEESFTTPSPPNERAARKAPADDKDVFKVPVLADDPVRGRAEALITIVEFADFQCPFCARVQATLEGLEAKYPGEIRIVWKNQPLPFHAQAKPAAEVGRYIMDTQGSAAFWKFHDDLFANIMELREDGKIEELARANGVDWGAVQKVRAAGGPAARVEKSQALAASVGARGTPHFFINGRRVPGAQPSPVFEAVIEQELVKARAQLKAGVPRARIYAEAIANGLDSVPTPPSRAQREPVQDKKVDPPPADAPYRGPVKAKVVVQVFSDFQCPFCSRVTPTIDKVHATFGKEVKIVWRNLPLPFHKDAPLAAEAALEAKAQKGNAGFWDYHDLLFANQRQLTRADLESHAKTLGLNMARFKQALDARTHKARVDRDVADAQRFGISGTPGFSVNQYFISGAQPFTVFETAINKALADLKKPKK